MLTTFKLIPILSLVATMSAPATSFAKVRDPAPCILREHRVVSVQPYRVQDRIGKATFRRMRGASVFVQAEPGLTAEWLQLKLQRHIAAMGSADMPDCAFDLEGVRVRVESGGTGFWVRLIAPDTRTGREILRRAELLLG